MSTDNITTFFDKARSDEALAVRINTIYAEADLAAAQALAELAREIDLPFTAEDLIEAQATALSDASLAGIAGGVAEGEPSVHEPVYIRTLTGRRMQVQKRN
jgi:hypothetical protein